jgi:oligopeptide/dipeptide ABC transporter ATP-binding protein
VTEALLEARAVSKIFSLAGNWLGQKQSLKAVTDVSLKLPAGETLGLVGESGCGKSTLGRILLALLTPSAGEVYFNGENIFTRPKERLRQLRQEMQIVFQDPYSSLNPRMTIRQILEEPFLIHGLGRKTERLIWSEELLHDVGLSAEALQRYPHEFSGGQRQRLGIARALALKPQLIVADEPVSALDVSVQAQILNLFNDLKKKLGLAYVFISHDLSVISHVSDHIAVMYLGRLVETAPRHRFSQARLHPYTEVLLEAVPVADPSRHMPPPRVKGDPPSPLHIPPGCPFHPRCPEAQPVCREVFPELRPTEPDHWVSCHFR